MRTHNDDASGTWSILKRVQTVASLVATVLMAVAAVAIVTGYLTGTGPDDGPGKARSVVTRPKEPISLDGAEVFGQESAKLVVLEYADFECPACAKFARQIFPRLRVEYIDTGKILFAFRHLPLPMHKGAFTAAQTAECAGRQGRFLATYEALFAAPESGEARLPRSVAEQAGLNATALSACIDQGLGATQVRRDVDQARELGVTSTPTFLFGHRTGDGRVQVTTAAVGIPKGDGFYRAIDSMLR